MHDLQADYSQERCACHSVKNLKNHAHVDAEGWMHFITPPHFGLEKQWCPGEEVFLYNQNTPAPGSSVDSNAPLLQHPLTHGAIKKA